MNEIKIIDVFDVKGKKVGLVEFFGDFFDVNINILLIYQVVVVQFVVVCQGIYVMKICGQVFGGGKKLWCQKGIGCVCQGLICVLQWVGGGIVYGLQLCFYVQCIFKKMVGVVLCGVLFDMVCDNCIFVVILLVDGDKFLIKQVKVVLFGLVEFCKVFVVLDCSDEIDWLLVCNFFEVYVLVVDQFNIYDVVNVWIIVFSQVGFDVFVGVCSVNIQVLFVEFEVFEINVVDQYFYGEDFFCGDNLLVGFDIKGNEDFMKFYELLFLWYGCIIVEVWFCFVVVVEVVGFVNVVKFDFEKEDVK